MACGRERKGKEREWWVEIEDEEIRRSSWWDPHVGWGAMKRPIFYIHRTSGSKHYRMATACDGTRTKPTVERVPDFFLGPDVLPIALPFLFRDGFLGFFCYLPYF
jgi:hypothetical protein